MSTEDAEPLIELASPGSLFKLGQHSRPALGVNELSVRSWIVHQGLARASGDHLVGFVDVDSAPGLRVNCPEDFPDIARHLPKLILAGSMFL